MTICQVCPQEFIKQRMGQRVCSPRCAMRLLKAVKAADRQETKRRKEAVKTRSDWMKEAEREFNAYIRARDFRLPCISCGRHHQGQYHAGHYRSVGSCPELRFDERNVHKQCAPCNAHLHGNLIAYRVGLRALLGDTELSVIEGPHEPKHYTIDELKAIKTKYRAMSRAIEKEN